MTADEQEAAKKTIKRSHNEIELTHLLRSIPKTAEGSEKEALRARETQLNRFRTLYDMRDALSTLKASVSPTDGPTDEQKSEMASLVKDLERDEMEVEAMELEIEIGDMPEDSEELEATKARLTELQNTLNPPAPEE